MSRKLNDREQFLWTMGREEPFLIQWSFGIKLGISIARDTCG